MQKINVAFIGCGRISDLHVLGYKNNKRANLYAVCDADPETLARRKKEWKVEKAYTDYREVLSDPKVNAVEVILPHKLHEPIVKEALDAKKHVAVQKPMAISLASADRMVSHAKKSDRIFKVTDNYLFYPPIVTAKKMIEDGAIGEPQMLRMKMIASPSGGWTIDAASYNWRFDEYSEGRFSETYDHGHHEWATAWYLLGETEYINAWIDSLDGIMDSPCVITWKYKEGIRYGMCEFVFSSDLEIPSKYYSNDEWFEITGSKGVIFIHRCTGDIHTGPAVSLFDSKGWHHYKDVKSDWADGFVGAAENFAKAIGGEEKPFLTGEEGREILRFTFALLKSARRRREVYLDEMDRAFPGLYRWRKKRKEIKNSFSNSFRGPLFGENLSRYAPQAKGLTHDFIKRFDPEHAKGWDSVVGLYLTKNGGVPDMKFTLTVKGGKASLKEGEIADNARIVITMPAGVWAAIVLGKKRIETALFKRQLKIDGEPLEGMKLRNAFKI